MRTPSIWLHVLLGLGMATAQAETRDDWRMGVLYWSGTIPCQQVMRLGLEDEARRINQQARSNGQRGVQLQTLEAGDGADGVERQIRQMRELLASRPDAIIVQPTDNAALAGPLREANRAGIPVIAFDQYISGGELASYITSDNHQAGVQAGEYIASLFAPQQELRLVLVEYPQVSSTVERLNGFLDGLRAAGARYRILKSYQAVQPDEGRQAGRDILHDFPDAHSIDVIFTVNNGGGLSVVQALAEAGRDEIAIATVDGDAESIANLSNRRLTRIDNAQFCAVIGATALQTTYRLLQQEPAPRHILIPVFPVTLETLERYPGWHSPLPASFTKPWPTPNPLWDNQHKELP
ncbi:MAG: sugar ABC transporter substrate-binding protein [Thiopseudomonas sp.]|nr:sugar ABC transporter substrate-binding protein [Thiopseudomonas sp.]